jgi:sulfur carrier protein ThiS
MSLVYLLREAGVDIVVTVHGTIRSYVQVDEEPIRLAVAEGSTVGDVVERLGIPLERGWNAGIGGKLVSAGDVLHDGDQLSVFDVIGGG